MNNDKREIVAHLIAATIGRVGLNSIGANEVRTATEIAETIMRYCPTPAAPYTGRMPG